MNLMDEPVTLQEIASRYRRFAENEAHGRSPLYEELALGVAGDAPTLSFLEELSYDKQQPNLLFAAVRHLCGTARDWQEFRRFLTERPDEIRGVVHRRRTQTNEPARCATLLPLLAQLPQPLALLEVGASAGLCLLPDRYAYSYNGVEIEPSAAGPVPPPRFQCRTNPETPIPRANIEIAWRMGLDLEPLDLRDEEQTAWLETLVWPGEENRLELLRQALAVARAEPPCVRRGDLRFDLPSLAAEAPKDATLVVFHSAALVYVSSAREREEFAEAVARTGAVWIANEAVSVLPGMTPEDAERASRLCRKDEFLIAKDGKPIAASDRHGRSLRWFGGSLDR